MPRRITVIVSQGLSENPAKRRLEEELVARLLGEPSVDVVVLPHLYDLAPDSSARLCLSGIEGHMIVCGWLYPRALHWVLDQYHVRGRLGETRIRGLDEDELPDQAQADAHVGTSEEGANGDGKQRMSDRQGVPSRTLYCLDLRAEDSTEAYVQEIRRLAAEAAVETVALTDWKSPQRASESQPAPLPQPTGPEEGTPPRRWYPVIDFSRCTNCLECIDFCLFGVYGIDGVESIVVEQPDNCRKGCPACSRVCPENAIIFPQHKSPTIAGSNNQVDSLKVDLSQLFGAADAQGVAARERDEQLLLAGREAVGAPSVSTPASPPTRPSQPESPRDQLDALIDAVDQFDV
ncbi:MAG: ATP-binding protein [Pirellulales bacterium]